MGLTYASGTRSATGTHAILSGGSIHGIQGKNISKFRSLWAKAAKNNKKKGKHYAYRADKINKATRHLAMRKFRRAAHH
jgi:hypothetical protein